MSVVQLFKNHLGRIILEALSIPIISEVTSFYNDFWIYIPLQISGNLNMLWIGRLVEGLIWLVVILFTMVVHNYFVSPKKLVIENNPNLNPIDKEIDALLETEEQLEGHLLKLKLVLTTFDKISNNPDTDLDDYREWANKAEPILKKWPQYSAKFHSAENTLYHSFPKDWDNPLSEMRSCIARAIEALLMEIEALK